MFKCAKCFAIHRNHSDCRMQLSTNCVNIEYTKYICRANSDCASLCLGYRQYFGCAGEAVNYTYNDDDYPSDDDVCGECPFKCMVTKSHSGKIIECGTYGCPECLFKCKDDYNCPNSETCNKAHRNHFFNGTINGVSHCAGDDCGCGTQHSAHCWIDNNLSIMLF